MVFKYSKLKRYKAFGTKATSTQIVCGFCFQTKALKNFIITNCSYIYTVEMGNYFPYNYEWLKAQTKYEFTKQ